MSKRARYHNDITQQWEYLDADAINNGTERVDVQKVKDIDNKIDVLQNDVNAHLAQNATQQLVINSGQQIINAIRKTPLTVKRINGRTIVNLIPPFTSRDWSQHPNAVVSADGRTLTQVVSNSNNQSSSITLNVKSNTNYVLKATHNGNIAVFGSAVILDYTTSTNPSFNSGANTQITVYLRNLWQTNGTFTFSDLILTEGTTQHDFIQGVQHTTGLYLQNATNGTYQYFARDSKGDVLRLADGERIENGRKWKTTEVLELTGREDLSFQSSTAGYKVVRYPQSILSPFVNNQATLVKYDGKILILRTGVSGNIHQSADEFSFGTSYNGTHNLITISNTDSGWGDSYTPTADEIKTYFMGWRMRTDISNSHYNGTGNKAWASIESDGVDVMTTTLPTSQAHILRKSWYTNTWKPYQLHYKLATPYWEEIVTEGQVVLEEGNNAVTLGSGMVVREVARPTQSTGNNAWYINELNVLPEIPDAPLKFNVSTIFNVYKNSLNDQNWGRSSIANINKNGDVYALLPSYYDPTAQYTVTYLAQPHVITSGITSAQAELYENIKSGLDSALDMVAEISKQTDVNSIGLAGLLASGSEIVETGSNANGHYVRWTNGLQVCYANRQQVVPASSNNTFVYTYPASFLNNSHSDVIVIPSLITANLNASEVFVRRAFPTSITTFIVGLQNTRTSEQNVSFVLFIIGRWKQ